MHNHLATLRHGGAAMLTQTEARKLRSRLSHPVIDADGHWAEFAPHMREEFRRIGGGSAGGRTVPAPAARSASPPRPSAAPRGAPRGPQGRMLPAPPHTHDPREPP